MFGDAIEIGHQLERLVLRFTLLAVLGSLFFEDFVTFLVFPVVFLKKIFVNFETWPMT